MCLRSFKKMILAILATVGAATTSASALSFNNYDNLPGNELITLIPGDDIHRVFYSLDVGTLSKNDVLLTMTEFMASNDTGATHRLSAILILADSPTATGGTELDEANVRDVTPNGGVPPGNGGMHHVVRVKGAIKQFTSDQGTKHYVNLIVWANGDFTLPGTPAGRLEALKISP